MDVGDDEEEAGAVGMQVAEQPALVDVAHDVLDRLEGQGVRRHVMHRQDDSGDDLDSEGDPGQDSEIPEIIEVARHRIAAADRSVDQARKWKPLVDPAHEAALRTIFFSPGEAHLMPPRRRSRRCRT